MAGRQGFEPRYRGPEPRVLPLDDLPIDDRAGTSDYSRSARSTVNRVAALAVFGVGVLRVPAVKVLVLECGPWTVRDTNPRPFTLDVTKRGGPAGPTRS